MSVIHHVSCGTTCLHRISCDLCPSWLCWSLTEHRHLAANKQPLTAVGCCLFPHQLLAAALACIIFQASLMPLAHSRQLLWHSARCPPNLQVECACPPPRRCTTQSLPTSLASQQALMGVAATAIPSHGGRSILQNLRSDQASPPSLPPFPRSCSCPSHPSWLLPPARPP